MASQDPKQEASTKLRGLTEYIAQSVVKYPNQVRVEEVGNADLIFLELRVAPTDMGRIIGKKGRVANAMRTLLRVSATQAGRRVHLEIIEAMPDH